MRQLKTFRRLKARLLGLPKPALLMGFLLVLICLAYLDYATSRFIQLSLFYALTAGLAGWVLGTQAVFLVVALSTVLAFFSDHMADPSVPLAIDVANHSLRAVLWSTLGLALVSLRKRLDLLDDAYDKIRTDLDAGRNVQMAFLSRPVPKDPRVELGVSFRTARELGGDYYDLRISEDKLRVLVADVSGKGASAALVTGLLGGLYSEITRRHDDPSRILTILDREITPSLLEGMFVTVFFLVLDLRTGHAEYASAGHDPQILLKGEEALELAPTGLPVGLMEGFELGTGSFQLAEQDRLVLFTDGIVNLRLEDGSRLDEETLLKVVRDSGRFPVAELPAKIFATLDSVGQLEDDALVLALRCKIPNS